MSANMSSHTTAENRVTKLDMMQAMPLMHRLQVFNQRRGKTIGVGRSSHANRKTMAARRAAAHGRRGRDQWTLHLRDERAIATEPGSDADVSASRRLTKGTTPGDPTYLPNQAWHDMARHGLELEPGDPAENDASHSWWSDDSSIDSDTADAPEPDPARFAHDRKGDYKATTAQFRVAIAPEDERKLRRHRLLLAPWYERKYRAEQHQGPIDTTPLNVMPASQLTEVIDKLEAAARHWPNRNRLLDELVARLKAAVAKASLRSVREPDLLEPTAAPNLAEPGYVDEDGAPYPTSRSSTPASMTPRRLGNPVTWHNNGVYNPTVVDYLPNWRLLDQDQHLIDQENPSLRIAPRPNVKAGGAVAREFEEILDAATDQIPELSGIREWSAMSEDPYRVPSAQEREDLTTRWQDDIWDTVYTDELTFPNGDSFDQWTRHDHSQRNPGAVQARLADRLGRGGQATCLRLKHPNTGTAYAVKVFRREDFSYRDVDREAEALTALNHENLIRFLSVERASVPKRIVLEFMNMGDMDNPDTLASFHSGMVWKLFIDVLCGLDEIHKHGIIHHDLSPDNIMLNTRAFSEERQRPMDLTFKISDFGMMTRIGTTVRAWGKETFWPPELSYGVDPYTQPPDRETYGIDIWGLFAILMCFWDPEFRGGGRLTAYIPQIRAENAWYARYLPSENYENCHNILTMFIRYHFRKRIVPLRPWSAMMRWYSYERPMAWELLEKAYKEPQYNFSRWSDTHTKEEACQYVTFPHLPPSLRRPARPATQP